MCAHTVVVIVRARNAPIKINILKKEKKSKKFGLNGRKNRVSEMCMHRELALANGRVTTKTGRTADDDDSIV